MLGCPLKMLPEDVTDADDMRKQKDVFSKSHIIVTVF